MDLTVALLPLVLQVMLQLQVENDNLIVDEAGELVQHSDKHVVQGIPWFIQSVVCVIFSQWTDLISLLNEIAICIKRSTETENDVLEAVSLSSFTFDRILDGCGHHFSYILRL